ncbi:MAG: metallophosphoesterase family protein [Acutalibacteraceae bacterium]
MAFNPVLRFVALSDVHYKDYPSVERERMSRAISLGYELSEKHPDYKRLDALFVVGDFTDRGTFEQMTAFHDTISKARSETQTVVSLASHEFSRGENEALERFSSIFGTEPDTHKVINGFHFISLSTTNGCRFSDKKINWARQQLEAAAADDPKKPIFFFQHPHISDTVYGSINWGEDELYATLMDYPQIINFSGHSHAPINDPRSIHQKHFTCLGTGSLSYFELDEFDKIYGTVPPKADECAQMLIVEADAENRVRIYPYDILTEHYFPFVWEIDEPSNPLSFKYTDKRYKTCDVPYFPKEAQIIIEDCDSDSIDLILPQAKTNKDYVNSYMLCVKETESGRICRQISFWSEYYFYDMPDTFSYSITALKPKTEYEISLFAESFWHTTSAPLSVITTTK